MTTWYVDPVHSNVGFGVKHMMVSTIRGRFGKLSGTLRFDPQAPERTEISVAIGTSSVDTGDERRDGHLRSPDFLDAATYPEITFASRKVTPKAEGYLVEGDLTIRNVTKRVAFDAELGGVSLDKDGGQHLGASASLSIDRRDWGLEWNQPIANGVLVGDKVKIELGVAAIDEATAKRYGMAA